VSTVHELISPVTGTVLAVNAQLEEHSGLLNEDPYSEGWLIEARLGDESELETLMDMDEYYQYTLEEDA
jgi:glycine cleavage system H protein